MTSDPIGRVDSRFSGPAAFEVGDAAVFRIEPAKVLAFAKEPHGQTTYRFG
jgi:hypothetical protein